MSLVTDTFLQQLIYRPPELKSLPLLSPRLQAITFDSPFKANGQMFGDTVASRWRIHDGIGVDVSTSEIARLQRYVET